MPSSSRPRKARPSKTAPKRITWDQLRDPIDSCQAALSTMALQISSACAPGTLLLTPSDNEEFHRLKTSCNKDLSELQLHLDDVSKHVKPRFGTLVTENDLMQQLNFGETLLTLLQRAQSVLSPDVDRLCALRKRGTINYEERQRKNAAASQ